MIFYGLGLHPAARVSIIVSAAAIIAYWWQRRRDLRHRAAEVIGAKARAIRARLVQTMRDRALPAPPRLQPERTPS